MSGRPRTILNWRTPPRYTLTSLQPPPDRPNRIGTASAATLRRGNRSGDRSVARDTRKPRAAKAGECPPTPHSSRTGHAQLLARPASKGGAIQRRSPRRYDARVPLRRSLAPVQHPQRRGVPEDVSEQRAHLHDHEGCAREPRGCTMSCMAWRACSTGSRGLDTFKLSMGFTRVPVHETVTMRPSLRPFQRPATVAAVALRFPTRDGLRKAAGILSPGHASEAWTKDPPVEAPTRLSPEGDPPS